MRIDKDNLGLLDTDLVCIHDDVYEGIQYDYNTNCVFLYLSTACERHRKKIVFHNVIGFQMIACDLWGASPHIIGWEYNLEEKHSLLARISKECDECHREHTILSRKLEHGIAYIETQFLLSSGDRFVVVCEYIDYCVDK